MIAILPILAVIFFAGILLYLANKAPIQQTFKDILNCVAIAALVVWLVIQFLPYLHALGIH
jgi:amino acid permease